MTSRTSAARLEPIATTMKDAEDSDREAMPHDDAAQERLIPGSSGGDRSAAVVKRGGTATAATANGVIRRPSNTEASLLARRRIRRKREQTKIAQGIKYAVLVLLVAQMVGLVLLLRYSRTEHRHDGDPEVHEHLYLASTAVFIMEAMKLVICLVMLAVQSRSNMFKELHSNIIQSPQEVAKLCVPSFLYTVQNNLLYFALTNLDAATYQVCYQLKILTTALFSAVLLGRRFSRMKWLSLVILTIGVAIVQISGSRDKDSMADETQNRFLGMVAVLCAACTSGFSGVYFERILKGSQTSLWMRNIQMGIPSVLVALTTAYLKDSTTIRNEGFFVGFKPIVWTVVTVQAGGGIIVALVVKYADNVLKVFATSFSIIISCVISAIFFEFHANFAFVVGATLVLIASALYSRPDRRRRRKPVLPTS